MSVKPAAVPIWKGSSAVTEVPGSPILERDNTRFAVTRIYKGPYQLLFDTQPSQNQAFDDLPAACLVVNVRVVPMPGGIGEMTVRAETSGPSDTTPFAPTYENEWVEVDRPVESHPIYSNGTDSAVFGNNQGTPGMFTLTTGDRVAVAMWQDEDDFTLRTKFMFKVAVGANEAAPTGYTATSDSPVTINGVPYNKYTLSTNAQNLAAKLLRGTTSYRVYAPVARETIESEILPTSNPCGSIEQPPDACDPPEGYVWLRSAQRGVKTGRYGKWQQQREWEGADQIDTDLYQPAAG